MARLHRRYRKRKKNPSEPRAPRSNPPLITEIVEWAGPGFGAFATARFTTRTAATQIAKRWPSMGKHAGGVAAIGTFLAAWLLANRLKWLAKYHAPIAVGAAIAMAQSLIQLYIPKLGWIVSDASPELAAAPVVAAPSALPPGLEYVDDEDAAQYQYNDAYDGGIHAGAPPAAQHAPAPPADTSDLDDVDLSDGMGIFGTVS